MLVPICAMVLAQLCVPSEYVGVTETTGGIHQVLPNGKDRVLDHAKIVSMGLYVQYVFSDYSGATPAAELRETCLDGVCVAHRRVCHPDGTICSYQIGWVQEVDGQPVAGLYEYVIRAHTRAIREEAERRLRIVDDEKPGHTGIPIAALTRSTPARPGRYSGAVGWQGWID